MATKKMKVLYCNPFINSLDGAGIHTREFIRNAKHLHIELIVYPESKEKEMISIDSIRHGFVSRHRKKLPLVFSWVAQFQAIIRSLYRFRQLQRLIKKQKPDLLFQRIQALDWSGYLVQRSQKIPLILELNAPLAEEVALQWGKTGTSFYARHEKKCLWSADAIIVVSDILRHYLISKGVEEKKIFVNPNGVDLEKFKITEEDRKSIRKKLGIPDGDRIIGYLGSSKSWHGRENILRAFNELKISLSDLWLLIIGEKGLAHDKTLSEKIIETGVIQHDEVPQYLAACDLAVAPYVKMSLFYFSPLKIMEYMAASLPIVATNQGQISELLASGRGVLYNAESLNELVGALKYVLEDPSLASEMGSAARSYAEKHLGWDRNVERIVSVFGNILEPQ
jgi:glycosyltransferase involved in cell wall biosynthesis